MEENLAGHLAEYLAAWLAVPKVVQLDDSMASWKAEPKAARRAALKAGQLVALMAVQWVDLLVGL